MKRLIALRRAGTLYYVVPDHLGGTLSVGDADGSAFDDIRYHAFGATRSGGTNTPTDKRFTGQTLDTSTGLYDFGARSLAPLMRQGAPTTRPSRHEGNPLCLESIWFGGNRASPFVDSAARYYNLLGVSWHGKEIMQAKTVRLLAAGLTKR